MRAWRAGVGMLLAVAVLAVAPTVATADGRTEWRREPGGRPSAVTVDATGSIYVTGSIWAPSDPGRSGVTAMVVAKYGPAGGLRWRRTWRPYLPEWHADGISIAPAPGGGVYVGGSVSWFEDVQPLLARYSASGRLLWHRTWPAWLQWGWVSSLAADERGAVAAIAMGGCCDEVRHDGRLQAFDPDGLPLWRTDFEVPGITHTWDSVGGVAIGADGRIYAAGHVDRAFFDSPDDPRVDEDLVVQQLSRGGDVRWTSVLGDGPVKDRESATDIAVRNGLVIVTASVDDETKAWVGALTTGGDLRWTRRWGERYRTMAVALTIAPWGPVYVAMEHTTFGASGSMRTRSMLRRYTRTGVLVGSRLLPEGERIGEVVADPRALYLTIGRTLQRWTR